MRFLIDQMFPHATCELLNDRGHDAVQVRDRGVDARPYAEVVAVPTAEKRVIVTENVKDFAGGHGLTVLCVLKSRLPPQGMHVHLAELLHKRRWPSWSRTSGCTGRRDRSPATATTAEVAST